VKGLKTLLGLAVVAVALYGVGRVFARSLGSEQVGDSGPAGVLFSVPSGFAVVEGGELWRQDAARELSALLGRRGSERQLGIRFAAADADVYWLVDRQQPTVVVLTEFAAGAGGTRVETVWRGTADELQRRLGWAMEHGSLEPTDLPRGEAKNLYH
jgi:hypothetical protein